MRGCAVAVVALVASLALACNGATDEVSSARATAAPLLAATAITLPEVGLSVRLPNGFAVCGREGTEDLQQYRFCSSPPDVASYALSVLAGSSLPYGLASGDLPSAIEEIRADRGSNWQVTSASVRAFSSGRGIFISLTRRPQPMLPQMLQQEVWLVLSDGRLVSIVGGELPSETTQQEHEQIVQAIADSVITE